MEEEGVKFVTNTNVGEDITAEELLKKYDRVILAVELPIHEISKFREEMQKEFICSRFPGKSTKTLLDSDFAKVPYEVAKGKNVLVIGGGDTGNDCVGTSYPSRSQICNTAGDDAKATDRACASNPWPQWPRVLKTDYGQEEAIAVLDMIHVYTRQPLQSLSDKNGNVCKAGS